MNEAERIDKRTFCERCGTCCIKGGPTLHTEDLRLFKDGVLNYRQVYTLRKGELVQEQIQGGLLPLEEEIVKIRGIGDSRWTCLVYDDDEKACTIYEDRPAECSIFNCWAPEDLEAMYRKGRLIRLDIVPKGSALAELIVTHEAEVPVAGIEELAVAFLKGDEAAGSKLADKVLWDAAFRSAFAEKTQTGEEEMNFFFGRPLKTVIRQFDLEIVRGEAKKYLIRKIS